MKNRKYIVIVLVIVMALSLGCVENTTQSKPIKESVPKEPINNPAPIYTIAPTMTSAPVKNTLVQYNVETVNRFVYIDYGHDNKIDYTYPKAGNKFVVVTLKITNNGTKTIKTNWLDWDMSVSTEDNPNTFIKVDTVIGAVNSQHSGINYPDAELETGGFIIGQIPFEVPANFNDYKIKYKGHNKDVNIEWQKDPTLSKPIRQ